MWVHSSGMFRRGRSYYVRLRSRGQDRWLSLGSNLKAAKAKLDGIREGEEPKAESGLTVAEAAEKWLASYVATTRNEKGQALASARVTRWLKPFMGAMPLGVVNGEHLRAYRLWLEKRRFRKRRLSVLTVFHVLSDARCFFRWCEDAGLIDRCPVPRKLLPRIQERPPDRLTDKEVAKLVALQEPYGFVLRFALGTGLRWSELCRSQAGQVQNGALLVAQTKSGKVRRVPLSDALHAETTSRVGRLVPFAASSPGSFAKVVRRLSRVERFHVHRLRHTFASRWVDSGGNPAALQQILGHASIITTQRYARLSDDSVLREARRIEAVAVATTVARTLAAGCGEAANLRLSNPVAP